jgi:transcriptional regulator
MYAPPRFKTDLATALAFAQERGFATFCGLPPSQASEQVPTRLYQPEHRTGPVRTLSEAELTLHVDALAAEFGSWLAPKPPWLGSEVSSGRRAAMMQAIVGLVMAVDDVEGSFKLHQHKSDADHVTVTDALARQTDPAAQQLARTMGAMRPQAFAAIPVSNQTANSEAGKP